MFDRVAYKKAAKAQLKGRWKVPVLSTLLLFVIVMVLVVAMVLIFPDQIHVNMSVGAGAFHYGIHGDQGPTLFTILICFIFFIFALAQKCLFERMYKRPEDVFFGDFVEGLGLWLKAVLGTIWKYLWVVLWMFLFYIPGIIKLYSYSMMFYIIAENPKISVKKALNISKELTRGYKGDLFVTDITFIPLYLLSCFTIGIGFIWLIPYYQATYTNIYHALKQVALDTKRINIEDFE